MHPALSSDLDDPDDLVRALGTVLDEGRGSLPYRLVHGESLVACASWALGDAGVTAIDLGTPWETVVDSGAAFVIHDSLCPMTPASFIAACLDRAVRSGSVVVGTAADGTVLSPVVLPPAVVAGLSSLPSVDLGELTRLLEERAPVERRQAPAAAARVSGPDDVADLERLTAPEGA